MPAVWTTEQVTSMAPDAASVAAGRKLADARQWQTLGRTPELIWGEIKGSGKNPYQAIIELAGPTFKCSCPSRKFPCKHGLGLAYVFAELPKALREADPPEWVREWSERRAERAQKKAERTAKADAPDDPQAAAKKAAAQEKRVAARRDKVRVGADELERWLRDLVRQGLAAFVDRPYSFWDQMAARLIDAQAPGLARWVRTLGEIRYAGSDWQPQLLDHIARLHLLLSAYQRLDSLDPDLQAEVDALIGFAQPKEVLLGQEGVRDTWLVLGSWSGQEEQLRVRRTWLHGAASDRRALLIDFAAGNQTMPTLPSPGAHWQAELVFYPGTWPVRALLKAEQGVVGTTMGAADVANSTAFGSIIDAQRAYADALTHNPWIERYPCALAAVTPQYVERQWFVRDSAGLHLPIAERCKHAWSMLSVSGGSALALFGEWDGFEFLPLTLFAAQNAVLPLLDVA